MRCIIYVSSSCCPSLSECLVCCSTPTSWPTWWVRASARTRASSWPTDYSSCERDGAFELQRWSLRTAEMEPSNCRDGAFELQRWSLRTAEMEPSNCRDGAFELQRWSLRTAEMELRTAEIEPSTSGSLERCLTRVQIDQRVRLTTYYTAPR